MATAFSVVGKGEDVCETGKTLNSQLGMLLLSNKIDIAGMHVHDFKKLRHFDMKKYL